MSKPIHLVGIDCVKSLCPIGSRRVVCVPDILLAQGDPRVSFGCKSRELLRWQPAVLEQPAGRSDRSRAFETQRPEVRVVVDRADVADDALPRLVGMEEMPCLNLVFVNESR
jgi:hypothetical protein